MYFDFKKNEVLFYLYSTRRLPVLLCILLTNQTVSSIMQPSNYVKREIIVYTDYVCPFCLLAEKLLREVVAGKPVKITWRPFELRPFPVPTLKVEDEYLPAIWQRAVYPMAEKLGIDIKLPTISPQPRTDKAFEAFAFAEEAGLGDEFSMATLSAFFQKNQDIGDIDVLLTIADDIGLERQALKRALETNEFTQAHQRALRRANLEDKISVVPTIIIGEARYDGVASKEWIEAALDNLLV